MSSLTSAVVNPIMSRLKDTADRAMSIDSGAQGTNILAPVTVDQANQALGNVNTGLSQQQQFLQALQAQNGIQNQSDVYNQLNQIAQGQGPNPAQAMLANATGTNVANQAALMAGQRGAAANPALIARQAAIQGSNMQQDAAGQAAALQAQQSLNAINNMGGMANTMVGNQANAANAYTNAALSGQQNLLNSIAQQNNANVGMQSNINNANSAANIQGGKDRNAMMGNIMSSAGKAAGMFAEGGKVGPSSAAGRFLHAYAQGGKVVDALVSPGEVYLPPSQVQAVKQGADPISSGEKIPGTPKVKGNSYANDTVPKKLEAGGIVIPNSVIQSKDPHAAAAKFVAAVLRKKA